MVISGCALTGNGYSLKKLFMKNIVPYQINRIMVGWLVGLQLETVTLKKLL